MERISWEDLPKGMYQVLSQVEVHIGKSGLDPNMLELMRYRVSQINHCAYCLDMHYKEAVHHGEDPQRLYSLSAWKECPYYSDKERAVLAFAEALTYLPDSHVDDDLFAEISRFFSKAEIAHLTLAIGQINMWNRITQSFGTTPGTYKVEQKKGQATAV